MNTTATVTVTVANRPQAGLLNQINSAANLLRSAMASVQAEVARDSATLAEGRVPSGGFSSSMSSAAEYRTMLQTLMTVAGSTGLNDEQVQAALVNDYIDIDRLDKDEN